MRTVQKAGRPCRTEPFAGPSRRSFEYRSEGKPGASSRGNSSSESVCLSCCGWKAPSRSGAWAFDAGASPFVVHSAADRRVRHAKGARERNRAAEVRIDLQRSTAVPGKLPCHNAGESGRVKIDDPEVLDMVQRKRAARFRRRRRTFEGRSPFGAAARDALRGNDWEGRTGAFVLRRERWNSRIGARRTEAKASAKDVFLDQERESEAPRRSDTVVVPTVNDADRAVEYWVRNEGARLAFSEAGVSARGTMPIWPLSRETGVFGFQGEYGRKAETWRNWRKGTTRSGACGLIRLNAGKLTRPGREKDWQIESSFLILRMVVHGRS